MKFTHCTLILFDQSGRKNNFHNCFEFFNKAIAQVIKRKKI